MWQKFTERARKAVFHAQEEAGKYGENFVATEHLLLGILHEENNTACKILTKMGVNPNMVREELKRHMTQGRNAPVSGDMQLTPRAKIVIDNAYDEAKQL